MSSVIHGGDLAGAGLRFGEPAGGWIDRIDTSGKSLSPDIPASSLYHLAGAAAAIDTHIAMV